MGSQWRNEGYVEDVGNLYVHDDPFSDIQVTVIERTNDEMQYDRRQPKYVYALGKVVDFFEGDLTAGSLNKALQEAANLPEALRRGRQLNGQPTDMRNDVARLRELQRR